MRGVAFAAAVAVAAVGVSLAGSASADTVIFSTTGTLNDAPYYYVPLPGEGTYDFVLEASRLASFALWTSYDNHVDIYKAPPVYSHDSNLLTGSNSEALGYQSYNYVTNFHFTLVVPPNTSGTIIADAYYAGFGVPIGSTLYTTVDHGNAYGRLSIYPNNGDPLEYTYTVTRRDDVAPVPEPATWALMILGFGAVGGAMRSRRRAAFAA